ncbi:helix-turn-helix domain-containing protein [Paenibacillus melissococcoides]|uniref:Helix-turn-helix domain-containing protein n=1 Tax=Paenibacillus melissococcoides TaxID=2912268 RepID=A0ABM9G7I4_9BACL|nr:MULTISPECIES: helix-turn-helix transcriptional regulator [Paenibacillus]MEB9895084.1 helix-turn-helix transcriptional regulator [Bacillus cereus]CAH8247332.1 helix-turn-helix domain-containing protein [Paenibacillus melissococcoides]CAH8717396.1 helix-turn-helix domain-containing protein [Paenibacillus melissococcoides]CAH8718383.1 helix-turn-helix domain-containing protein [Paenibacillus melissococcoides]GIO77868.1 hypothetical protein J6TS7_14780 [Paenibacillus dendritiformis]
MELKDRIRKIINDQNLKQKDFAESIKVTESYVSNMLSGKRSVISEALASLIQEKFGYSMQWILTGEGEIYENASSDITLSPIRRKAIASLENMNDSELAAVLAFINSLESVKSTFKNSN